ncbi:hypothetical protein [Chryseobacterium cheonjiense]|uniref:Holin n=1 Tax=Chryseobacterium cheonjiense TaxID=2728845 RepID=A0A7Y0A3A4_9FLAO|nr:hypothetical protein [Chryseobacterium cheonjiense]NML55775.1 hypothetical protein [Chryseobacterium cheonjiense]
MNNVTLPKDKELAKQVIESQSEAAAKAIDQGWLGKIWGNSLNAPNNIAGLTVICLILVGIIYTISTSQVKSEDLNLSIKDFWAIITPLITLSIGYLFGDKRAKK